MKNIKPFLEFTENAKDNLDGFCIFRIRLTTKHGVDIIFLDGDISEGDIKIRSLTGNVHIDEFLSVLRYDYYDITHYLVIPDDLLSG